LDYLWRPWRYPYLTAQHKPEGCIFCLMSDPNRDVETFVVFRGEHNFVVLNRYPYTTGHLMIAPYRHVADLAGMGDAVANEMMALTRAAERHLRWLYRPEGLNLGMNIGASAGAGVAGHIHMHVLPRWTGDASFITTVGETRVLSEELPVTWKRLREEFRKAEFGKA